LEDGSKKSRTQTVVTHSLIFNQDFYLHTVKIQ